jgi:serine phosphatase RsbU (regulator of sigma subunit)
VRHPPHIPRARSGLWHVLARMTRPELPPIQVLLVEDDAGDALLVEEHFARSSISVALHRVTSLAEAIDSRRIRVDCVLLDLALPDARDLEALGVVLDAFDAPVVVLTGFSDHDLGVAAVSAGAEDYLAKNEVDPALLERSVRYAIERHRTKDTSRQLFAAELRREENLRLERGLLPHPLLDDDNITATTRYRAGGGNRVIGGDFFDAVQLPDGSVRAVIGDVCGHGPDEAALGVNMRIAWRTLVLAEVDDDTVLPMLERLLLVERSEDLFVTVCDVTIAPDRRAARYRLAGHPSPMVIDATTVRELPDENRSVPLGVTSDARWPTAVHSFDAQWALLMFTDGLFEVRSGPGTARLGVDGLLTLLAGLLPLDPAGRRLDRLLELVEASHGGPLDDDVALLQLRSNPE